MGCISALHCSPVSITCYNLQIRRKIDNYKTSVCVRFIRAHRHPDDDGGALPAHEPSTVSLTRVSKYIQFTRSDVNVMVVKNTYGRASVSSNDLRHMYYTEMLMPNSGAVAADV